VGAALLHRALYREASWLDTTLTWLMKPIWALAVRYGWSWSSIKQAFTKAWRSMERRADSLELPDDLFLGIVELMAARGIGLADFMHALDKQVTHLPAGYRVRVDSLGLQTFVKVRHDTEESVLVRGSRFRDAIFIGCWWTTELPKGSANRKLQNLLKRLDGDVFWRAPYFGHGPGASAETAETRVLQYGGFAVVPRLQADAASVKLCAAATACDQEGAGEHRLSAVSLVSAADGREVRADDQVKLACINSLKWNWRWNLTDLLMGRITDFRASGKLQEFLTELRQYRGRTHD
jgi:hypothetical protein